MRSHFLVATFYDPDRLMNALRVIRRENFRVYDVYAPYPIHGIDKVIGIRKTRLPWVTFVVGLSALTFALLMQFYMAVLDWPLNVGGKPDNSTLAFIPITFEATVLLGGLSIAAAFLFRARLYPGKKEQLIVDGVTNDVFALVLRKRSDSIDLRHARELLKQNGANVILEKEAEL